MYVALEGAGNGGMCRETKIEKTREEWERRREREETGKGGN